MALTKEKKEKVVEQVQKAVSENETVAFVNFHGLGVEDTTQMRRELKEQGVGYTVAKKTLVRRALDGQKVEGDMPSLDGELAIAYGSETSPARGIYEFGKKHKDTLTLLGGIFEGRYVDAAEISEIAQIPSLDVLRGMFVNLINSPLQRFAIVLNEISKSRS